MRRLVLVIALGLTASGAAQEPQVSTSAASSGPWTVFFDWGKPDLRRDDGATLDLVAAAYRARPSAHVQLSGHTDRSGSAAVNRVTGLKRAQRVRAELEKVGIPRNAMRIVSFGEERLLVPTEDGVREVQNRRVEIALEE